ncbi:MAG TPA: nuclear transport factor 2 family protein [Longimicrobium sp.]|jgi:ketosteroid isomerase-like protein
MTPNVAIVQAWIAAVNAADVDAVLALSAPDIGIAGPRGTAKGHEPLRAWLGHAGATFEPVGTFHRGDSVVVAHLGVWPDGDGPVEGATRFRVRDGQVAEMERYSSILEALRTAGLTMRDI